MDSFVMGGRPVLVRASLPKRTHIIFLERYDSANSSNDTNSPTAVLKYLFATATYSPSDFSCSFALGCTWGSIATMGFGMRGTFIGLPSIKSKSQHHGTARPKFSYNENPHGIPKYSSRDEGPHLGSHDQPSRQAECIE